MSNVYHKRIQWPDLLKAFAIILVVFGHIFSTYSPEGYYNPFVAWIYSFHLPLFMMLSGMFFKYTLDKPFVPMLLLKCQSLILPLISWATLLMIFQLLSDYPVSEWSNGFRNWVHSGGPFRGYWYLKCLFVYLVVGYIMMKVIRNTLITAIISSAIFILLPNINFSRMMILFFWGGYIYGRYNKWIIRKVRILLFSSMLIMLSCYLCGWYKYTYLVNSNNIGDYFRFIVMGGSASLFYLLAFNWTWDTPPHHKILIFNFFAWIGTISLGIYCIHPLFYDATIYQSIVDTHKLGPGYLSLWSIVAIVGSILLVILIHKSNILSFILLGKRLSKKVNKD